MKKMEQNIKWIGAFSFLFCWLAVFQACKKNGGDYAFENQQVPFKGNTYEYLKSKPSIFDSLLKVIDRLQLADTLINKNITLFAVTNESFQLASDRYNIPRLQAGLKAIDLKNYNLSQLDSLTCRYIIKGNYPADSMMLLNGLKLSGLKYSYPMNAKKTIANASGMTQGGASFITYSDTQQSTFIQKWKSAAANSVNIRTSNGYIHILDGAHVFGFDGYTKPVSLPYKGITANFPLAVGASTILEAEDFDIGGQGVSYYDSDAKNAGNLYRLAEAVDIYSHPAATVNGVFYSAGFDVGATVPGEWLNYSISVPETGEYQIQLRYGTPANAGNIPSAFHFSVDWKNVTGRILAPVTSTATNNFNTWASIPVNIRLTAGKHYLQFCHELSPIEIESYKITRIN